MLWKNELVMFLVAVCLIAPATGCGDVSGRVEWERGRKSIENHVERDEATLPDALRRRARVVIETPATSFNSKAARCEVHGTFDEMPTGWQVYALLESPHGFFLQWPPVRVDLSRHTFTQRNIRIGHDITELHIVLANSEAAEALDRRASRNDWSAIPLLPDGIVIYDTITID